MQRYFLVAIGGAAGALLRYIIGAFAAQRFGPRFPVGTLTINLSACFLVGLVLEYLNRHTGLNPVWRYGVAMGFVGAYSTFSTFEWEIWSDITSGAFWMAWRPAAPIAGYQAVTGMRRPSELVSVSSRRPTACDPEGSGRDGENVIHPVKTRAQLVMTATSRARFIKVRCRRRLMMSLDGKSHSICLRLRPTLPSCVWRSRARFARGTYRGAWR